MRARLVLAVLAALTLPVACSGEPAQEAKVACDHSATTTKSGLEYSDLECGSGPEARRGDLLTVHYVEQLEDGTEVDSSRERGETFDVRPGSGLVIPGWEEGLIGVQEGTLRKLVIPPDLAYGENGVPPDIPPNATLTFEIEVLEIKDEASRA